MHLSRSSSRIVMVTLGIRIMANLPDRKDGHRRVDHGGQSGHFYLAESGHFYLGITTCLRVTGLMLRPSLGAAWLAWQIGPPVGFCAEPHKPPTLPRARSGTSGPLPAPSPGNGIATHPPVHSRLGCSGGPRAPSGSSL